MEKNKILQDAFLNEIKKDKMPVSIFLVNGIKLHGIIDEYDQHVIMLKNTITQMVYKHAVSTVVPSKMIQLSSSDSDENMAN